MPRWEDDSVGRLQRAALTLFAERGYDAVTVAEIATLAGLTRRTFFNHFADKREIFFAGAPDFHAAVIDAVRSAPAKASALDVAVGALISAATMLTGLAGEHINTVRRLMTTTPELRERELAKMATLSDAVTVELMERGEPGTGARAAARLAVAAFTDAWDDLAADQSTSLPTAMRSRLDAMRASFENTNDVGPH